MMTAILFASVLLASVLTVDGGKSTKNEFSYTFDTDDEVRFYETSSAATQRRSSVGAACVRS